MNTQPDRQDGDGLSREQVIEYIRELNTIAGNCDVVGTAEFSRSAHNLYHIAKQWFKSLPTRDAAEGAGRSLNDEAKEYPPFDNPRDPLASPDRFPDAVEAPKENWNCFWPRCSDSKRCRKFGSCVALAQRKAIAAGDFPYAMRARLPDQYDGGFVAGRKHERDRQIAITLDRDRLGQMVRHAWVEWAKTQDAAKPSWLLPYDELSEADKEADRQIGEYLIEWAKKYVPAALSAPVPSPDGAGETVQILLDLLNPLHGELDKQTYDEKLAQNFDAPRDAEYEVTITAQQERDLTQAVCFLESRLRLPSGTGAAEPNAQMLEYARRLNDIAVDVELAQGGLGGAANASDLRRIAQQIVATPPPSGETGKRLSAQSLKHCHRQAPQSSREG